MVFNVVKVNVVKENFDRKIRSENVKSLRYTILSEVLIDNFKGKQLLNLL